MHGGVTNGIAWMPSCKRLTIPEPLRWHTVRQLSGGCWALIHMNSNSTMEDASPDPCVEILWSYLPSGVAASPWVLKYGHLFEGFEHMIKAAVFICLSIQFDEFFSLLILRTVIWCWWILVVPYLRSLHILQKKEERKTETKKCQWNKGKQDSTILQDLGFVSYFNIVKESTREV